MTGIAGWPPRWVSDTSEAERDAGDGDHCAEFIESFGAIIKDSIGGAVGDPVRLDGWQRELLRHLFARRVDGRRRHRVALVGVARKNGKSTLAAGIALWELFCGVDGGEVFSCAADREQARIVFGTAKAMVQASPDLAARAKVFRDVIEVPEAGSIYRVLSSEAYTKEGLNPTLVIFDEVHAQPNAELWDVMALASGSRREPLLLGITTAGVRTDSLGHDSHAYGLYRYGLKVASGEIDDLSFGFAWWEPSAGMDADHLDPDVWAEANPGLGTLVAVEDFRSTVGRTSESEFRAKRCNQWVASRAVALPHGAWDACAGGPSIEELDVSSGPVALMVDGSWNGDCTGIVGCLIESEDLFVVDCWERPAGDADWRVPISDVMGRIVDVSRSLNVVAVAFDPFRWQQTIHELAEMGIPVEEFPTGSVPRMVAAWKAFYDAVLDHAIRHDGDVRLARHVDSLRLKLDRHGARPVKEHGASNEHIDLAICAIGALVTARAWSPVVAVDPVSQIF